MSLAVDNLRVHYRTLRGDVRALDGVTFRVADGEIMGLAGESGCGKSTLGKSLIRMDARMRYVEGRVELDGAELPIWDDAKMNPFRLKSVSIIPTPGGTNHHHEPSRSALASNAFFIIRPSEIDSAGPSPRKSSEAPISTAPPKRRMNIMKR